MKVLLPIFLIVGLAPFGFAVAQDELVPTIRSINNSLGFREHRPGWWSFVNPLIRNPTDKQQELEVVAFFAATQNKKFAKRVLVPPKSTLRISLPILVPSVERIPKKENSDKPSDSLQIQVHLYDVSGAEPRLLLNKGKRSYDTDIGLRNLAFGESGDKYRASALFQPAVPANETEQESAEELVTATRMHFNQVGRIGKSYTRLLPESMRAFESIDQIVIHNDQLLYDSAGLESVRRWLARGGNLWIMLDLVSEETVRLILGEDTPFQLVDRTSLNTFQIKDADPNSQAADPKPVTYEEPIKFARVVVNQGQIFHLQDDWPASFQISSGQGSIFFTTIGARAWMRELDSRIDRVPDIRLGITEFTVSDPMEQIGYDMFAGDKPESRFDFESLKENLINQVGYRVLSRQTVIAVLLFYIVVLLVCGIWFSRTNQLEKMFYVGPALAIVAGLVFFWIGQSFRQAAKPAVASFQLVQPIPGGNELQVDGMTVVYSQDGMQHEIKGSRDGTFRRDVEPTSQEEKKIAWDGLGTWKIAGGKIEPGVVSYRIASNVVDQRKTLARAAFTEQGLTGFIDGGSENLELEDLVLVLPTNEFLAVNLQDRSFTLTTSDVMSSSEFIRSSILTDKQRWHQSVYRTMFPADIPDRKLDRPALFGWSPPLEMDIEFPESFVRTGGALTRIPFEIERTPPNTKVTVPAALIDIQNVINSRNAISPVYEASSRKWLGSIAKESTTRLRFQLPPQVLPLKLDSVALKIDTIQGLNRRISIKSVKGVPGKVIKEFDDFNGRFETRLDDEEILVLDENGGFLIDIDIEVKPEFYERKKEVEESGELNSDGTKKKLELNREELKGITLEVFGVTEPDAE